MYEGIIGLPARRQINSAHRHKGRIKRVGFGKSGARIVKRSQAELESEEVDGGLAILAWWAHLCKAAPVLRGDFPQPHTNLVEDTKGGNCIRGTRRIPIGTPHRGIGAGWDVA